MDYEEWWIMGLCLQTRTVGACLCERTTGRALLSKSLSEGFDAPLEELSEEDPSPLVAADTN